jgi:hypothetical protein
VSAYYKNVSVAEEEEEAAAEAREETEDHQS